MNYSEPTAYGDKSVIYYGVIHFFCKYSDMLANAENPRMYWMDTLIYLSFLSKLCHICVFGTIAKLRLG